MACKLAGLPVPQRAPAPTKPAANSQDEAARQSTAISKAPAAAYIARVGLGVSQVAPPPAMLLKRAAPLQLTSGTDKKAATQSTMAGKQATVEDAPDEDAVGAKSLLVTTTAKKRVAFVDPAVLREQEDGRTKRGKPDEADASSSATLENSDIINKGTCASCLDLHYRYDLLQLGCKDEGDLETHAYCRDCLQRLFESSVTDPSHFPPRCCSKIISLFACTPFLPQPLIAKFVTRREELGTPNRTYCSNNKCSRWVHPAKIVANVATCSDCSQQTCATCKAKQHNGLCPEDKAVQDLLNVARQKRWQTCPNCKEMVELERGCNHIT